jgi:Bacterial Ig domain
MRGLKEALAVAALALSTLRGEATECLSTPPRFNLAPDTVHWDVSLASGTDCIQGLCFTSMEISLVFVATQPKNGSVIISGPSFRYRPNQNFEGTDDFSLSVNGAVGQIPGNSIIEVEVTVR